MVVYVQVVTLSLTSMVVYAFSLPTDCTANFFCSGETSRHQESKKLLKCLQFEMDLIDLVTVAVCCMWACTSHHCQHGEWQYDKWAPADCSDNWLRAPTWSQHCRATIRHYDCPQQTTMFVFGASSTSTVNSRILKCKVPPLYWVIGTWCFEVEIIVASYWCPHWQISRSNKSRLYPRWLMTQLWALVITSLTNLKLT